MGGEFFQEEGRQSDSATWRKESLEKESSIARGNSNQERRYVYGESSTIGDSYLMGKRGDANINEESISTNQQLGNNRCELEGK